MMVSTTDHSIHCTIGRFIPMWWFFQSRLNIHDGLYNRSQHTLYHWKVHTNVVFFLVQVEYSRRSLQQTIVYIVPLEGSFILMWWLFQFRLNIHDGLYNRSQHTLYHWKVHTNVVGFFQSRLNIHDGLYKLQQTIAYIVLLSQQINIKHRMAAQK